jgi:beta-lactam-binding protein with PASTA domain
MANLTSDGFYNVSVVEVVGAPSLQGHIVHQSPRAGTIACPGDALPISVSK